MLKVFILSLVVLCGCHNIPNERHKEQEVPAIIERSIKVETLKNEEKTMQDFLNSTIGTVSVLVLVYIAGGITFAPAWAWVKSKIPFLNK